MHFNERNELFATVLSTVSSAKFNINDGQKSVQFYEGADYDPLIGQWTSPGISNLVNAEVTPFYPYQIIDPVNSHPLYNHMTRTSSWLEALGFQLDNIVPDSHIWFKATVSTTFPNMYVSQSRNNIFNSFNVTRSNHQLRLTPFLI